MAEEPAPWSAIANDSAVERQAAELSERLREVQARLDIRESELNSRQALLEAEARRMRLHEREQQIHLQDLEATKSRLVRELEARTQALSTAEHSNNEELARAEEQLKQEAARLDREREKLRIERRRLQKQADLLHHSQQGLDDSRTSNSHQWRRLQQELQLESAATQLQHARLLKQAERAAESVHEKQRTLAVRTHELMQNEEALARQDEALSQARDQLAEREKQLAENRQNVEQLHRDTHQLAETLQRQATDLQRKGQHLEQSKAELTEREALLKEESHELQSKRRRWIEVAADLDSQQSDLNVFREAQENELSAAWRKLRSKLECVREEQEAWTSEQQREQKRLATRTTQLDQKQAALVKLRSEIRRLHFETLEVRLASEELVASHLGPQEGSRLMAKLLPRIRQRIADHFRDEIQLLANEKADILALLGQLQAQQKDAQLARKSVKQWFERRRREIEEEASRLIARQHELNQQAKAMQSESLAWARERLALQQTIRDLSGEAQRQ